MKAKVAAWHWEQACQTLDTMHAALTRGNYNNVVMNGYHAMEQAARALLAANDTEAWSHHAVHVLISRELVKTGKVGPEYSKTLRPAYRERTNATYGPGVLVPRDEAEAFAAQAHEYVSAAKEVLRRWGVDDQELADVPPKPGSPPRAE